MRRFFKNFGNRRKLYSLYTRYSENSRLGEGFEEESYERKKLINSSFYDKIKFNPPKEIKETELNEEEVYFSHSIDLLKEVEIRVLNYINDYSDTRILNIEDISLDTQITDLGILNIIIPINRL